MLEANRNGRDCRQLQESLNAAGAAVLAESRLRQARYDRETDSGRKQGVDIL